MITFQGKYYPVGPLGNIVRGMFTSHTFILHVLLLHFKIQGDNKFSLQLISYCIRQYGMHCKGYLWLNFINNIWPILAFITFLSKLLMSLPSVKVICNYKMLFHHIALVSYHQVHTSSIISISVRNLIISTTNTRHRSFPTKWH